VGDDGPSNCDLTICSALDPSHVINISRCWHSGMSTAVARLPTQRNEPRQRRLQPGLNMQQGDRGERKLTKT
jgi:hypothetical protein